MYKPVAILFLRYWFLKRVINETLGRPLPKIYTDMFDEHNEKLKTDLSLNTNQFHFYHIGQIKLIK